MPSCNTTLEFTDVSHVELSIGITFHHLGLIIAAVFGLVSIAVSGYLIVQHAFHYSRPTEQVHIIRILFMIPIYSTVSFLSYLFYKDAIYYQVLRDCYEAFAISSFFTLICNYLAPTLHDQKDYFRAVKPNNWILPINWLQKCTGGEDRGPFRKPASGLTWFNIIYLGVFQYCFVRILFTIVSVITQAIGRYCVLSINPAFAHVWVTVFEGVSVTIAMYTLIQFYIQLRHDLVGHRPKLKLACIKLVIFFSFWQTLVISFLSSAEGPLQPTKTLAYPDIAIGIPSVLLCVEMAFFAVLHIFAFPWKAYQITADSKLQPVPGQPTGYLGGHLGWKAYAEAFNPWDILKATARGFRWLFVGRRKRRQDASYREDGSWGGAGAFDGDGTTVGGLAPANGPTKLQTLSQSGGWSQVPTIGVPTAYGGPHQGRPGLSRGPSAQEDDDTWAMHADPDEDYYSSSQPLQRQPSYDVGAEDRAGLLRHPQRLAGSRTGVSPVGSDSGGHDGRAYDKETSIEEQYQGYGRYSWGNGPEQANSRR